MKFIGFDQKVYEQTFSLRRDDPTQRMTTRQDDAAMIHLERWRTMLILCGQS